MLSPGVTRDHLLISNPPCHECVSQKEKWGGWGLALLAYSDVPDCGTRECRNVTFSPVCWQHWHVRSRVKHCGNCGSVLMSGENKWSITGLTCYTIRYCTYKISIQPLFWFSKRTNNNIYHSDVNSKKIWPTIYLFRPIYLFKLYCWKCSARQQCNQVMT